jgi:hypothetical protein
VTERFTSSLKKSRAASRKIRLPGFWSKDTFLRVFKSTESQSELDAKAFADIMPIKTTGEINFSSRRMGLYFFSVCLHIMSDEAKLSLWNRVNFSYRLLVGIFLKIFSFQCKNIYLRSGTSIITRKALGLLDLEADAKLLTTPKRSRALTDRESPEIKLLVFLFYDFTKFFVKSADTEDVKFNS